MFMPRSLAKTVDQIARHSVGKDWSLYAALLEHWQEIVGTDYAADTMPAKITFPFQPNEPRRCNGTLTIKLPKGLMMEFSFKNDTIKQRINNYFGYQAVTKIQLDAVYGIEAPPLAKTRTELTEHDRELIKATVEDIESDELRQALEAYGTAMFQNRP